MKTIKQILLDSNDKLSKFSPSPRIDAELILQFIIKKSRTYLYSYPEKILSDIEYKALKDCLEQRVLGKPIAYITGHTEFWSLELEVNQHTLIPRSDTEILIEVALEQIKMIEGLLFISMIPLHNEDIKKQLAFYTVGVQKLNKIDFSKI